MNRRLQNRKKILIIRVGVFFFFFLSDRETHLTEARMYSRHHAAHYSLEKHMWLRLFKQRQGAQREASMTGHTYFAQPGEREKSASIYANYE